MKNQLFFSTVKVTSNQRTGAGFFFSSKYIITASHNIDNVDNDDFKVFCTNLDGSFTIQIECQIVYIVPRSKGDIALIEVLSELPSYIKIIPLGKTITYSQGNEYFTFGFPKSHHVNGRPGEGGILSSTIFKDQNNNPIIQLYNSNFITRGFSGGSIIDAKFYEIVGMIRSVLTSDELGKGGDVGFGIPIEEIKKQVAPYIQIGINRSDGQKELTQVPEIDESTIIGRESDYEEIDRLLSDKRVLLLRGVGGVGKTVVALGYVQNYRRKYNGIIYITINSEIVVDFLKQVAPVISNFQLDSKKSHYENFCSLVNLLNEGYSDKRLLIVIDNADAYKDFESKRILSVLSKSNLSVLFTSRLHPDEEIVTSYQIKSLDLEYCKKIFNTFYKKKVDDISCVDKIIELVNFNTLLVKLVAKAGSRMPVQAILNALDSDNLRSKRLQTKIYIDDDIGKSSIHSYIVNTVYNFNPESFTEAERKILDFFSVLPSFFLPYDEVISLFNIPKDDDVDFWNNLDDLHSKGWVEYSIDHELNQDLFRMHPIIQEVIITKQEKIEYRYWEDLVIGLRNCIRKYADENAFSKVKFIPFIEKFMSTVGLEDTVEKFDYVDMLCCLGSRYLTIGDLVKYQEMLQLASICLGGSRKCQRYYYSSLASYYWNIADYNMAYTEIKNSIDIALEESELIPYYEAVLYDRIGLIERRNRNISAAQNAYLKSIDILEEIDLPIKRKKLAISTRYNNLSYLEFYDYNHKEKGIEYALEAASLRLKYGGKKWPALALTYSNLALFYNRLEDYEKANEFIDLCIEVRKEYYHDKHDKWAITYRNKAHSLLGLGEIDQASIFIDKAIEIRLYNFDESYRPNWMFYEVKSRILLAKNKYQDALLWAERAKEILTSTGKFSEGRLSMLEDLIKEITDEQ